MCSVYYMSHDMIDTMNTNPLKRTIDRKWMEGLRQNFVIFQAVESELRQNCAIFQAGESEHCV